MGGQACILYGGAEFSRDTDIVILSDKDNLQRLQNAIIELNAECIAVPPFDAQYLDMGLAVHFRCRHPEAMNQRIDVMSRMRGVAPFAELWSRRTTVGLDGEALELLGLPDLVQAKKTQRDKDWPMITRLLEAHYIQNVDTPTLAQVSFWLRELRTPQLLIDVAKNYPEQTEQLTAGRPLLKLAQQDTENALRAALNEEEQAERAADYAYWLPLRKELERLRLHASRQPRRE